MAAEPKDKKVARPYSLKPTNIKWLADQAADQTIERGTYVSASALLDALIDTARKAEEVQKAVLDEANKPQPKKMAARTGRKSKSRKATGAAAGDPAAAG